MHSLVTIINTTVLDFWKLLRELILNFITTHTEMIIMWGNAGVNELYYGKHFAMYTFTKSSHYTP